MKLIILFSTVTMLCITACAPTLKMEQYGKGIQEVSEDELPHQVAILPFSNVTDEVGIDALVRRNFANHFSSKSYLDMKLPIVDEKVILTERKSGKAAGEMPPAELAAAMGVDGLLYGKVIDYQKLYAAVYSQLGIEAEVWMVNAKTGKELFRLRESVRYHEGGIPTSPLSAIVTVVSTALNLREIQKVRLVNELCYKFMGKIPSPKSLATDSRPVIREVMTNAGEGPFGPRKVVRVGLQGDPGLVAFFDMGNFKRGLPMKEVKSGIYSGEYAVLPGDNTRDMPVLVTLSRPGGYDTQWVDVSGYVTIDTTPPPPVAGLRVKGYPDRVELAWNGLKNVPDLKGYRVQRSESPLSGYKELAVEELPSFVDKTPVADKTYYYRIVSLDRTGNEAEPGEPMRGTIIQGEPRKLAGSLKADTIIEGPALITATLTVPKGVSLTVGGGSRLVFAAGAALHVQGKLEVQGGEAPVEFFASGEGEWGGIKLESAAADMRRFIVKGATVGIHSKDSEISLENGHVSGCATGISIAGMSRAHLKGVTISGNTVGLRLYGTASRVTGSTIVQNSDGILADGFSGEIRDNNIVDNGRNLVSEKPLAIGPNWFGSVEADLFRLTNVTADKVYDALIPGGKMVAAVVNPYLRLTPEERQKKGAELIIEAGGYFRQRNYGKAATLFSENLQVLPTAETYYYLALCHQEMRATDKALVYLKEGSAKFPQDAFLWKALGMLAYERGDVDDARKALEETLRLSPGDSQARFMLERLKK